MIRVEGPDPTAAIKRARHLYLSNGDEAHFRPRPHGHDATSIHVFDRYREGKRLAKLDSSEAIWKFFAGLKA